VNTHRLLRYLLIFGMAGILAELFLLEHTDDLWQKLPLALLAAGLLVVLIECAVPSRSSTAALRLLMALFILAGAIGLYQHYAGNLEFERELNPARRGWDLVWETLKGATPALAPGAMIYLGVIGLAYASSCAEGRREQRVQSTR
jgi:hypothetical protein